MDQKSGGWRARARGAALMFGSGGVLAGLSVLPTRAPQVNKPGILVISVVAVLAAGGILAIGRRYTIPVSHATSFLGTLLVAGIIHMAGGTFLGIIFSMFYIWVVLFAVFFYGTRGAVAHATICSLAVAIGLSNMPIRDEVVAWALDASTMFIVVACYNFMQRYSARLRGLVEHSGGVVTIVDQKLVIQYQSPLVERILGYPSETLIQTSLLDLVHPEDREHAQLLLAEAGASMSSFARLECRVRHNDGSWRHTETSVENLFDDSAVEGLVLSIRDVTGQKELEQQLTHQAFHDPLTGLANRALFADRAQHALSRLERSDTQLAVLLLDLDDFKSINDSLGHGPGDQLLVTVAERLMENVRGSDTVARLGGDEFAILIEDAREPHAPEQVAQRLLEALSVPSMVEGTEVFITPSIGAAVATTGRERAEDLLRDADAAMYVAKRRGKGRYERFQPGMHEKLVRRLQLKSDLRRAVEREELRVYYQPTVRLNTGEVCGVEALIRWQHPALGLVPPNDFIPLAEETGLIVPIGRWVLREACAQARRWHDANPGRPPLKMCVNVSGRQLDRDDFVDDVEAALRFSRLDPATLVLEITEGVLLEHLETTVPRLERLKKVGVQLAIDDFGTGYSSLSYLHKLPVDLIKIDKSFVDEVRASEESALLDAIVQLGRSLELTTVAEGIEHEIQVERLNRLDCDFGQGYLFARPLTPDALQTWLSSQDEPAPEADASEDLSTAENQRIA